MESIFRLFHNRFYRFCGDVCLSEKFERERENSRDFPSRVTIEKQRWRDKAQSKAKLNWFKISWRENKAIRRVDRRRGVVQNKEISHTWRASGNESPPSGYRAQPISPLFASFSYETCEANFSFANAVTPGNSKSLRRGEITVVSSLQRSASNFQFFFFLEKTERLLALRKKSR